MSSMGKGLDPRVEGAWVRPGLGKGSGRGGGANHNEGASLDCKKGRVGKEPWFERRNLRGVGPPMKGGANKVWARLIVGSGLMAQMVCSDE